ncbi:MAG: sodium:proton antiporter [Clostridiales bacterium]|nr:sodium:proton antiporter [Clostridiales bacterium]
MLLILFALWVLFNGRLTLEVALIGLVLSAVLCWFSYRFLGYSFRAEKKALRLIPAIAGYVWLLICEIVKSNLCLLRIIYLRKETLKPQLVTFRTPLKSNMARIVLSNSITLTPGTITCTLEEDTLTVHCLDASMAEGLEDLAFQKKLLRMEQMLSATTENETEKEAGNHAGNAGV